MRRFDPANLRAAWWAVRAARRTRRVLDLDGLDAALAPPPPPRLPAQAKRGVRGALRRTGETCLVNSIVLQAWEAAHGQRRDLVVGITGPDGFRAHAWLQGDAAPVGDDAGLDASALGMAPARKPTVRRGANATADDSADAPRTGFTELLRRPAPRYDRAGSMPLS